ncbi:HAMP domain-containing sensor histidine kinase [Candidatus Parabeggiatoa sp. HSG14]|uniref:sensor histidine kinase n=1 Tax=Candidatus Parabeggiatoa sp. HSG14 TaxID=3055593 RepID=UPI0025A807EC|nr:HAMP domain-containing sensor histidine kinase [Thiotrichales bacterium HSG14]
MKPIKLLYTSTFHLALVYMVLFASSVLLLLGFIYWATAGYMARQTDATIEAEITGLAEQYRRRGLQGLVIVITERMARNPNGASIYLFAASDYSPLAGNLSHWPQATKTDDGWLNFHLKKNLLDGKSHPARARPFLLRGGLHLLVGRDIYELKEIQELILSALSWGLAITLCLALIGGLMMSWSMVHRLEIINQTSRQIIMTGDLSRRIPTRGTGDDFDQLVDNLNTMLVQIEELMVGVQQISDNIAHDLRTPLTRLRNRLEQMRWQKPNIDQYHIQIEQSITEADQLLLTFNALLRIARIESGSHNSLQASVDLEILVRDASELYEALAEEKQQLITIDLETCPQIQGDRDLLFQALANLLDNAVKYTPEGGNINITLQHRHPKIEIIVADTGTGIPLEVREKVLQRFYRLETSRSTPGNGLGLSLVAAVTKLHHAQIKLENNTPTGLRVILVFSLNS